MKILALDTSTEACSAALYNNGEISSRYELLPQKHAELILPMIEDLLVSAGIQLEQVDAVAFGRGPGAFTGVRIAAGIAQGLAYSVDIPVIPVSSLSILAYAVRDRADFIATAIDARMGEIYFGIYDPEDLSHPVVNEQVIRPENILMDVNGSIYGTGSGWLTYREILTARAGLQLRGSDGNRYPEAEHLIQIAITEYNNGHLVDAEAARPVYLRNKVTG